MPAFKSAVAKSEPVVTALAVTIAVEAEVEGAAETPATVVVEIMLDIWARAPVAGDGRRSVTIGCVLDGLGSKCRIGDSWSDRVRSIESRWYDGLWGYC